MSRLRACIQLYFLKLQVRCQHTMHFKDNYTYENLIELYKNQSKVFQGWISYFLRIEIFSTKFFFSKKQMIFKKYSEIVLLIFKIRSPSRCDKE